MYCPSQARGQKKKKKYLETMKGLDTVESLSGGAAWLIAPKSALEKTQLSDVLITDNLFW